MGLKLTTNAWSSSAAVRLCRSPGGFVHGDHEISSVDVFFARGIATSEQLVIVHSTLERWNEKAIDRDAEDLDDFVEDVERGVGSSAFDVGNGLTRDACGFGERGL